MDGTPKRKSHKCWGRIRWSDLDGTVSKKTLQTLKLPDFLCIDLYLTMFQNLFLLGAFWAKQGPQGHHSAYAQSPLLAQCVLLVHYLPILQFVRTMTKPSGVCVCFSFLHLEHLRTAWIVLNLLKASISFRIDLTKHLCRRCREPLCILSSGAL